MSQYTDKNIPITCCECPDHIEEGVIEMQIHIALTHPEYTNDEVIQYAKKWAEAAYQADEEREMRQTEYARGK